MNNIENRKIEHIQMAKDPESQINKEPFVDIKLPYKTLPEIDYKNIDTSTTLLGNKLAQPLIIASMTGGTNHANVINKNIAVAVQETKIAMGVGSQRIALQMETAKESFKLVREFAPEATIFANMGAVQLNYGKGIEDYLNVVDMIRANALFLHINSLQEAIQPEGDTNFERLLEKIHDLVDKLPVPVFVKEVGHGFDKETANKLAEVGIAGIDIAGANGTSWAWIEAKRKGSTLLANWFKDFGISIEDSLANVNHLKNKIKIIASGGIRNPIQGVKAHTLGADYYSAAYPFLNTALEETPDNLIRTILEWEKGLRVTMFCCGYKDWSSIKHDE